MSLACAISAADMLVRARVHPSARTTVIGEVEVMEGELQIKLSARPIGGAANEALVKLLANTLRVPKSSVAIITGRTSTHKLVSISTNNLDSVVRKLSTDR